MAKQTMLADDSHAFLDRSGRYPLDAAIRKLGYQIHARKNGQQPVWCKRCYVAQALAHLADEQLHSIHYLTQQEVLKRHGRELDKIMHGVDS